MWERCRDMLGQNNENIENIENSGNRSDVLTAAVMEKMIIFSEGQREDINHFLKVHSYARLIGIREGLRGDNLLTLELAAVVHDIACPLCREKYGDTEGSHQEAESEAILGPFLQEFDLPEEIRERIIFLVTHHHTYTNVDGLDYQILLEADYLVNCDESEKYRRSYRSFRDKVFRTRTGVSLLESMFPDCRE